MKFAHLSDCHLGAWSNHPELRELPVRAFEKAMNTCMKEKVDFILIAGDLFDTSLPPIDILKSTVTKLRECSQAGISVYIIAGSHDFSPTGKTMISVLEEAGLLINVAKADIEEKISLKFSYDRSGALITGLFGKKNALESVYFENLEEIEKKEGFKIFLFHSAITEFKPEHLKEMPSIPLSLLPKNFDYYASGHVHEKFFSEKYKLAFPGALFPTNFQELEKYDSGFLIIDVADNDILHRWVSVKLLDVELFDIDAKNRSPQELENEIIEKMEGRTVKNKIVLIKMRGILKNGNPSDIDFRKIFSFAYQSGAKAVKKNISRLKSHEFEEIKIGHSMHIEEIEKKLIEEHLGQIEFIGDEKEMIFSLMDILKEQQEEGENLSSFQERIKENTNKILGF